MQMYTMPTSSSHKTPPVVRKCHANTRWIAPLKRSTQATNTLTAIPANCGAAMATKPATISRTLSPIDQPTDFFTIVPTDVALMTSSSLKFLGREIPDLELRQGDILRLSFP